MNFKEFLLEVFPLFNVIDTTNGRILFATRYRHDADIACARKKEAGYKCKVERRVFKTVGDMQHEAIDHDDPSYGKKEAEEAIDYFVKLVQADCQPFLEVLKKTSKEKLFVRGVKYVDEVGTKETRVDRKPKDTAKTLNYVVSEWFIEKFGRDVRSENAVFTYVGFNRVANASSYGIPSFIVPTGNFQYVYSDIYIDLYSDVLDDVGEDYYDILTPDQNPFSEDFAENTNLYKKLLRDGKPEDVALEKVEEKLKRMLDKVYERLADGKYTDKGLHQIMTKRFICEVMLTTKKYHYISTRLVSNYVHEKFGNFLTPEEYLIKRLLNEEISIS